MITTTTDHIEGYRITEYLGVVFADAANYYGRFPNLNNPDTWDSDSKAPKEADAIIGIQYFANEYGLNVGKSYCKCIVVGTAVKIEKI